MSITALASLSGSPGVTTTAVALATTSTAPALLVEADTTGGSTVLAGRYRAQTPHQTSLLALATAEAGHTVTEVLREQSLQLPGAAHQESRFVPGVAQASQSATLAGSWGSLGAGLRELSEDAGVEVILDLGRIRPGQGAPWGLVEQVDQVILLAHATLPGLIVAANNLGAVAEQVRTPALGVCLLAAPGEGYTSSEAVAGQVLGKIPALPTLPWDPRAASVYSLGAQHSPRRTHRYHSALTQLWTGAQKNLEDHRRMLTGGNAA